LGIAHVSAALERLDSYGKDDIALNDVISRKRFMAMAYKSGLCRLLLISQGRSPGIPSPDHG
jgi:hypothetical protein